jgi:serine/threonine-protein kinase
MGEVYQAKDQKLGREVAIKVLPEEFAKDADRVARFQREAKLLASLNHPNIASIYGLEESDGTHFLVLELIEGDTLADRLKRGAIPVEESLKLALQIAEALEAAHEKGVIHRDLKPANIKVTPDGKVKVLDFGLAKAFAGDQGDMNLSNSPTLSVAATQQGVILGTAAYMSPEQAKGKSVDKRTDVWAFGCVVFEMLSGRSVFAADDVSQTLARVLEREPNFSTLPPNLHPRIRFLLERCLKKEAKNRYSGISDARVEIQEVLADPSGVLSQPSVIAIPKKRVRLGLPWVAAALVLSLFIAGIAGWILKPSEPSHVHRFYHELPEDHEFGASDYGRYLSVSADGTKIVYAANGQLYLKNSNQLTAIPIKGTDENPADPFFSPDGQWIGYFSLSGDSQLKKISIMGGTPVTLCEVDGTAGATWGTDDMIVFGGQNAIKRISAGGGTPEEIIKGGNGWLVYPQMLPDGKAVLFSSQAEGGFQVTVQSLESEEPKLLFPGWPAQYLPTGHLVYGMENTLTAIRFDTDTLETIGGPIPLVEDVFQTENIAPTHYAISQSGTLVYIPGRMGATYMRTLVWVDREGKEEPLEAGPNAYTYPSISPDGTQIALSVTVDGNRDIYIYDLDRGTMPRLTLDEAEDLLPIWTPDGQRIVFCSEREGNQSIFWTAAGGTGNVEQIASVPDGWTWPWSISNDGSNLFFGQTINTATGGYNVGTMPMEGDRSPKLLLQQEYNEFDPQISPDGRWLAYTSDESGQSEIYLRPFPDVDSDKTQVSVGGGSLPLWSPDGKELFYISISDQAMAVSVETEQIFRLEKPQNLFDSEPYGGVWDIHPDGKRFLMIKEDEATEDDSTQGEPRQIIIVLNWFEELKDRVPTD